MRMKFSALNVDFNGVRFGPLRSESSVRAHLISVPPWKRAISYAICVSKPTWKLKHANFILRSFEHLGQISSKSIFIISSYAVVVFETQCKNRVQMLTLLMIEYFWSADGLAILVSAWRGSIAFCLLGKGRRMDQFVPLGRMLSKLLQ